METKCNSHGVSTTAYCRKHRVTLCTQCLIDSCHQNDTEECDICRIETVTDQKDVFLFAFASVKQKVSAKLEWLKEEEAALSSLENNLTKEMVTCFDDHIKDLETKKMNTLTMLEDKIKGKREYLSLKKVKLEDFMEHFSGYEKDEDELKDARERDEKLVKMHDEIRKIGEDSDKVSTRDADKLSASFVPIPKQELYNSLKHNYIGSFDFSDEKYELVAAGAKQSLPLGQQSEVNKETLLKTVYVSTKNVVNNERRTRPINERNGVRESDDASMSPEMSLDMSTYHAINELNRDGQPSSEIEITKTKRKTSRGLCTTC